MTTMNQNPSSEEGAPLVDKESCCWWRQDPKKTFSDWVIKVSKAEDDGEHVDVYNVHKCILVSGGRRSGYFARLFNSSDRFEESKDSTSRLELDTTAAEAFPALLDYLYAPDKALEITTVNANALYHLGEYLDISQLRWDVKQFCQKDISLLNAEAYYHQALQYSNESILDLVGECLGKNIEHIHSTSPVTSVIQPSVWTKAAAAVDPAHAKHWSRVVCGVGRSQPGQIEQHTLEILTAKSAMPWIDPRAAMILCELEDNLTGWSVEEEFQELSSLQQRCATAFSRNWKILASGSQVHLNDLRRRRPSFLVDFLVKALKESHKELQESQKKLRQSENKLANCGL